MGQMIREAKNMKVLIDWCLALRLTASLGSACLIPSLRLKLGKCEGQKGHRYSSPSLSSSTGLMKLVIAQWSSGTAFADDMIYIFFFLHELFNCLWGSATLILKSDYFKCVKHVHCFLDLETNSCKCRGPLVEYHVWCMWRHNENYMG